MNSLLPFKIDEILLKFSKKLEKIRKTSDEIKKKKLCKVFDKT